MMIARYRSRTVCLNRYPQSYAQTQCTNTRKGRHKGRASERASGLHWSAAECRDGDSEFCQLLCEFVSVAVFEIVADSVHEFERGRLNLLHQLRLSGRRQSLRAQQTMLIVRKRIGHDDKHRQDGTTQRPVLIDVIEQILHTRNRTGAKCEQRWSGPVGAVPPASVCCVLCDEVEQRGQHLVEQRV